MFASAKLPEAHNRAPVGPGLGPPPGPGGKPITDAAPAAEPDYRLEAELAAGRESRVVRARDPATGEAVVLKVLAVDAPTPERLSRFRREYEVAAGLESPRLVRPRAYTELDRRPALVLPDFDAVSCDRLLAQGGLGTAEAAGVALGAARALADLHGAGMVHKDVAPDNILYRRRDGRVWLADFGLTSALAGETAEALPATALEGTLAYLAPEQTGRLNRGIDLRSDFYGLGATLFALLTGRPPFAEADALALVHCHLAVTPPAPSSLARDVPAVLDGIVARLLAKTPEGRYQSDRAVIADLEACYQALQAGQAVPHFTPGARDIPLTLRVPQALYGRDEQVRALTAAFEAAAAGGRSLTLVAGPPGIGKSALVHELYKPVTAAGGLFLAGKFDRLAAERPYAALGSAFAGLVDRLLAAEEAELTAWQRHLTAALGANAPVLAEAFPATRALLGDQPAPEAVDAEAQRQRLHYSLVRFVGALVRPDQPLVLFLDDVQWADSASLVLLERLLGDPAMGYLHLVVAYRDSEVDADHPLAAFAQRCREGASAAAQLDVRGLDEASVAQVIADALACAPAEAAELARRGYAKTLGNPFFLAQLLERWYRDGALWPDPQAGCWRWDAAALEGSQVADNVRDLMAGKLAGLPESCRHALALAAVLGSTADPVEAADLAGLAPTELQARLWPALQAAILQPVGEGYKHLADTSPPGTIGLRFAHDRLQEAALENLTPSDLIQARKQAGWRRLAEVDDPETDARLFDALGQLNSAAESYAGTRAGGELSRLNLIAGRRAQRAAAYEAAQRFFEAGLAALGEDGWDTAYDRALALTVGAAEAAQLMGDSDRLARYSRIIHNQARQIADTVPVRLLAVKRHVQAGDMDRALSEGRTALRRLGLVLPAQPSKAALLRAVLATKAVVGRHDTRRQQELGPLTDARLHGQMDVLAALTAPAYYRDTRIFALIVLAQVRLLWRHGNHPAASYAFAAYAVFQVMAGRPLARAQAFRDLASALLDRPGAAPYRCATRTTLTYFIDAWQRPPGALADELADTVADGLAVGDFAFAGYGRQAQAILTTAAGTPVGQARAALDAYLQAAIQIGQHDAADIIRAHAQLHANLAEEQDPPDRLAGPYLDEGADLRRLRQAGHRSAAFYVVFVRVFLAYTFGEFATLVAWRDDLVALAGDRTANPDHVRGLAMVAAGEAAWRAAAPVRPGWRQRRALDRRLADLDRALAWSGTPDGLASYVELARAERAALAGRLWAAQQRFDRAAAAAGRAGQLGLAGLARERLAQHLLDHGLSEAARPQLAAACHDFARWEATAKLARLGRAFPGWASPAGEAAGDRRDTRGGSTSAQRATQGGSLGTSSGDLDLDAVLRAAQAIAQDIQHDALVANLMRTTAQTAGATHGSLLLADAAGTLRLEARLEADADPDLAVLAERPGLGEGVELPEQIVRYVQRSRSLMNVDQPDTEPSLRQDAYLCRVQPASVLALPLLHQDRLLGVLYLEHRHNPGAFPERRSHVLSLLSQQMAIALDHAQLYAEMEQEVAKRTRELEALVRTDPLTGIANRRHIMTVLDAEFARSRRYGNNLAVLVLDLDHFKAINDRFGHGAGDSVLVQTTAFLAASLRKVDTAGRLGGEEFMVVLPETDGAGAEIVAERIRAGLPEALAQNLEAPLADALQVTCSIGVATSQPPHPDDLDTLIQRADDNAYRAKEAGRNRVVSG